MNNKELALLRATVQAILQHPFGYDWSYQGLGMLRLYLSHELRMHIWNPDDAVEDVSTLHTHPWHLESVVLSGMLHNTRYVPNTEGTMWCKQTIKCGEGGCAVGSVQSVRLRAQLDECYVAGDFYSQRAHEIHESKPMRGTVSVVRREFLSDAEHADVFWSPGKEWVSAEPRIATHPEIRSFTSVALDGWVS